MNNNDDFDNENNDHVDDQPTNIAKDWDNILFLKLLHGIQGVSWGLVTSVTYLMSARNVSYADQGTFSISYWPYTMNVILGPVVDSVYSKRFGRRKSWIVTMQFLLGLFFIFSASYVHELFEVNTDPVQISKSKLYLNAYFNQIFDFFFIN